MSLKIQTGDLLRIEKGILLHQVNTQGVVGGLAGALCRKYPEAFATYFSACRTFGRANIGSSLLGSVVPKLCSSDRVLFIAHIFGQEFPGANTDLSTVESALQNLADQLKHNLVVSSLPLYAPYLMGCGLGGGRWAEYEPIIERNFPSAIVIKLPEQK